MSERGNVENRVPLARCVGRAYLPDIEPLKTRFRLLNRPCRAGMPDLRLGFSRLRLLLEGQMP
jgi:hypothetical protein